MHGLRCHPHRYRRNECRGYRETHGVFAFGSHRIVIPLGIRIPSQRGRIPPQLVVVK